MSTRLELCYLCCLVAYQPGVILEDCLFFFLTKSQSFNFTNKDSGARCRGESLLAQRGKKAPSQPSSLADIPPQMPLLQKPSFKRSTLPSTSCVSISHSDSLTLYGFFLHNLCSLPINWFLALPLDRWLTLD